MLMRDFVCGRVLDLLVRTGHHVPELWAITDETLWEGQSEINEQENLCYVR